MGVEGYQLEFRLDDVRHYKIILTCSVRDVIMSPDVTSYPIKIKISVDFRYVANHMQMWLGKKMEISHFGYWHFLSTANTDLQCSSNCEFHTPISPFLPPYQCETERNKMKQDLSKRNKTDLHHVYLWHTLRGFQNGSIEVRMSVPIKKSNLIIRISFRYVSFCFGKFRSVSQVSFRVSFRILQATQNHIMIVDNRTVLW
jgi:hypothetical protein